MVQQTYETAAEVMNKCYRCVESDRKGDLLGQMDGRGVNNIM